MAEKFERKNRAQEQDQVEAKSDLSKKDVILQSKMPEHQKIAYLKKLGLHEEDVVEGRISFSVYARIKSIGSSFQKAMLAYPKAKGISLATVQEWDAIFKNF